MPLDQQQQLNIIPDAGPTAGVLVPAIKRNGRSADARKRQSFINPYSLNRKPKVFICTQ